jgi:hypothetical protein
MLVGVVELHQFHARSYQLREDGWNQPLVEAHTRVAAVVMQWSGTIDLEEPTTVMQRLTTGEIPGVPGQAVACLLALQRVDEVDLTAGDSLQPQDATLLCLWVNQAIWS